MAAQIPKTGSGHSVKHTIIDKDNSKIVVTVAIAVFIIMFGIFAGRALISQISYQARVIDEKSKAKEQVEANKEALATLKQSYDAFIGESENILGGNPTGEGRIDGRNDRLVLDALPNKYDYPALSSSFEKLLKEGGYDIGNIGGEEDAALASGTAPTGQAEPILIPYNLTFSSTSDGTKEFLQVLERSIRPMHIDTLNIQISSNVLQTTIGLHTYFTAEKSFEVTTKVVQ